MRYLVAMSGAAGFALVTGAGLYTGRELMPSFLGGLLAALGFALLMQWWTDLMVASYQQSLVQRASQPPVSEEKTAEDKPAMTDLPEMELDKG